MSNVHVADNGNLAVGDSHSSSTAVHCSLQEISGLLSSSEEHFNRRFYGTVVTVLRSTLFEAPVRFGL